MRLDHTTERDASLPHQVVIYGLAGGHEIVVSCNCLAKTWPNMATTYEPMGIVTNLEESRALYNNPVMHRISFNREDVARW